MHVCVLSHFSRAQFFAILWTVAHQAPLSLDSPGKNIGVVSIPSSRGSSQPRDQTHVSYFVTVND